MKYKLGQRIVALTMALTMSLSLATSVFAAEATADTGIATTELLHDTEVSTPENGVEVTEAAPDEQTIVVESNTESEDTTEQQTDAVVPDQAPIVEDDAKNEEKHDETLPADPEIQTAAEKCVAYEHISDVDGCCTICGADLYAEFDAFYALVNEEESYITHNAIGWYSKLTNLTEADATAYADYQARYDVQAQAAMDALDVYTIIEMDADNIREDCAEKMMHLYSIMQMAQYYYDHPADPTTFRKPVEEQPTMSEELQNIYNALYNGAADLPDQPTGFYISEATGLPVLTGDTKISISVPTSADGCMEKLALSNGSNSATIPAGFEVPVLVQIEYPGNGATYRVELPKSAKVVGEAKLEGTLIDTTSMTMTFMVDAYEPFCAKLHYSYGDEQQTAELGVYFGEYQNSADEGNASTISTWQTGSGFIGLSGYVGSEYLIGTAGGAALYCLDKGLHGRANGCPAYSPTGTGYVTISSAEAWTPGAAFGTSAQASNQLLIWAGSLSSSAPAAEQDEFVKLTVANEKIDYIIQNYPDSKAAKIYTATIAEIASRNVVSGTVYVTSAAGWQRVLAGARLMDGDEEIGGVTAEYYAEWEAPAQTKKGSLDYKYGVKTDKIQHETLEKVDGATIEIEPIEKSGSIDGGSWAIHPADKQTVTTSGHTNDDAYHNNGGDATASWDLHYEVTKTSGPKSGREGPYPTQEEADAAADAARDAAINELKADAQRQVDAAIAAAKNQLATLPFRYQETEVPYGYTVYLGSNGYLQTISVPANTTNDYLMRNDEWALQVNLKKVDSETGNQIAADTTFEVFEWDVVKNAYIPYGGYNQYKMERQDDGTYAVINHSSYATSDRKQHTMYYTQRNEGKFLIVEMEAPDGYYGDWTDVDDPIVAGKVMGKRAYYIEINEQTDDTVIWLDNKDYNADIADYYTGGTLLIDQNGENQTVVISPNYKDASRVYRTDIAGDGNNENSYTMTPMDDVMQNDRVLGEIRMRKADLDAGYYADTYLEHGNGSLEGAIYDLYAAEDIHHPDGVTGIVDYSKITYADGTPIWHTTIRDNAGQWDNSYLPVLKKDHLVATAEIVDGCLTFSNLYLGKYYVVERSTGTIIPVNDGVYALSGTYPRIWEHTKQKIGISSALAKNTAGEYTDYVYKNQFSGIAVGTALDGSKTYDGYYLSHAEGYLVEERNHYITPAYRGEGYYVEQTAFYPPNAPRLISSGYADNCYKNYNSSLCTSYDQIIKSNLELYKRTSSTGQSNGVPLSGAGFTVYKISELSKADQFATTHTGMYKLDSILSAYVNTEYDNEHPKYDFSGESDAVATMYEEDFAEILAYNLSLTVAEDYRNGKGNGWMPADEYRQYRLSEIFTNDNGCLRIEGLPYGQYLVVETTTPKDKFQAEPFIFTVDGTTPQSAMCDPTDAVLEPSDSYVHYTILDEEIETYIRITKIDDETGKPVLLADTAFQIYWLDDDGRYIVGDDGNPKLVTMTNTVDGSLNKEINTFYTTADGYLALPEKLPLGKYRIVEVSGPNGFWNEWKDTATYNNGIVDEYADADGYLDFEITTDTAYEATGDDNEDGQDTLVINQDYHNHETLGLLTIRKTGEVLNGWAEIEDDTLIDPGFNGQAVPGDFTYVERPLANAEYTIYANKDIYTQDRQLDADGNRTLWYAEGDVVAVVTTGDGTSDISLFAPNRTTATYDFLSVIHDGTVGEVSVTLPLGEYRVVESKPPYGYVGTDTEYVVSFVWNDELNEVVMASEIVGTEIAQFEVVDCDDTSDEMLEEQVLKFHNEREKASVGVYKLDKVTGEYVAGAIFNLYTADDIYDADGNLIFAAGNLVATSPATVADGYTYFDVDIPIRGEYYGKRTDKLANTNSGNYYIQEIKAPDGYYLNDEVMEVSFTYDGEVVQVLNSDCENMPTHIKVSKQDLTNGEELPGATLTITDAEGNVVKEWVSGEEPTDIYGLHLSEVYTLTEVQPALGYAMAESVDFRLVQKVDDNGDLLDEADVYVYDGKQLLFFDKWVLLDEATVVMKDDTIKVEISKVDIVSGEELPGAELIITDEDGNEIERWTSSDTPHYIEKLPAGKYILTEITAPDGYGVAESVPFEVLPIGEIQSVVMKDAPVFSIDKVDAGGELLPGAILSIRDKDGTVIDQWTTTAESHKVMVTTPDEELEKAVVVSTLLNERVYTLVEDAAPAGYAIANTIQFKVVLDTDDGLVVYIRSGAKEQWTVADGKTITMVDHLKPKPDHPTEPTPDEPTPTPVPDEPVPTPVPTPTPVITVPQTGDSFNMTALVCIALGSLMAIGAISFILYHSKKKTELAVHDEDDTNAE